MTARPTPAVTSSVMTQNDRPRRDANGGSGILALVWRFRQYMDGLTASRERTRVLSHVKDTDNKNGVHSLQGSDPHTKTRQMTVYYDRGRTAAYYVRERNG